ncbi:MAG: O-antigen ligase family protein [Candidatus Zixiibacteriota bacterium]
MVILEQFKSRAPLLLAMTGAILAIFVLAQRYPASDLILLAMGGGLGLAGLWLAIARQKAVYLLLIGALPFEATLVIEAGFSVTPYYVLFGLLLVSFLFHQQKIRFDATPSKLLLAYLAVCAVSLVSGYFVEPPLVHSSVDMEFRSSAARPFIQFGLIAIHILFFALILDLVRSRERILESTKIYLWIGFALAVLGCWQTLAVALDLPGKDFTQAFGDAAAQGYKYGETRFYSALVSNFAPRATFRESLHFAHYLVSFLPLAIGLVLYRKQLPENWRIKAPTLLVVFGLVALFLTMSRSGWLAFACSIAFMFCFFPKGRMLKIAAVSVAALLTVGVLLKSLGYFQMDLDLWQLMQMRMDVARLESDPRVFYLQILLETFSHYPVLGVGIGNYGLFGAATLGSDVILSAHSIFLNALVETGLFGFLLLSSVAIHFFYCAIKAIRRSRGQAAFPILVGVTAGVFGMTVQYCSFGDRPGFHYLFMLAIGYALIRYIRENGVAGRTVFS